MFPLICIFRFSPPDTHTREKCSLSVIIIRLTDGSFLIIQSNYLEKTNSISRKLHFFEGLKNI